MIKKAAFFSILLLSISAGPAWSASLVGLLAEGSPHAAVSGTNHSQALYINRSFSIRGPERDNRAVLTLTGLSASADGFGLGDGIVIDGAGLTVVLENLVLIPSLDGSMAGDMIKVRNAGDEETTVILRNVLIAPNNGADAGVATSETGFPDLSDPGVVRVADDGVSVLSSEFGGGDGAVNLQMENVHVVGAGGLLRHGDGISFCPAKGNFRAEGLRVSQSARYGLQIGTPGHVHIIPGDEGFGLNSSLNGSAGLYIYGSSSVEVEDFALEDNQTFGAGIELAGIKSIRLARGVMDRNGAEGLHFSKRPPKDHTYVLDGLTFQDNLLSGQSLESRDLKIDATVGGFCQVRIQDTAFSDTTTASKLMKTYGVEILTRAKD